MPLVTITTHHEPEAGSSVYRLAKELPELLILHREALYLDPETSPEAVRVCFTRFSRHDVNIPEIAIYVVLTEQLKGSDQEEVRELLERIIMAWFEREYPRNPPSLDMDIEWATIRGFMVRDGRVTHHW